MEIVITGDNCEKLIFDTNKIMWKSTQQRQLAAVALSLFIGLVFLVSDIIDGHKATSGQFQSDLEHATTTINNYQLSFGLGVALIFLSLYLVYIFYRQKRSFFTSVSALANRRKRLNNNFKITVTDLAIEYEDFELSRKEKWSGFKYFKISNQYAVLLRDHNGIAPAMSIPLNTLSDIDRVALNSFLKSKLLPKT